MLTFEFLQYVAGFEIPGTNIGVVAKQVPPTYEKILIAFFGLQIGPGIVQLFVESFWLGKGVFLQHVTPQEPLIQRITHNLYLESNWPTMFANCFLLGEAKQVAKPTKKSF